MKTTITPRKFLIAALLTISLNVFAQCPPTGNQTSYGINSWIGYVYSGLDGNNPPLNAFSAATYQGYITQPAQFNLDLGTAAISGPNLCGTYADRFSVRYKMTRNMPAGTYTFIIGGDDGVRLSVDGGATWAMSNWNYHSYQETTATIYLSGNVNFVFENYDQGGESRASIAFGICTTPSTAPTSITGTTSICRGDSTTLTADGGTLGTNGVYQWGTGAVGNNVIANATGSTITASPTANTTYWVRRIDAAPCALTTAGASQLVTVTQPSTNPTVAGATICLGSSATITAVGSTPAAGPEYQWGVGSVVGNNIIAGEIAATITLTPAVTTTYWVRRLNSSPCSGASSGVTFTVNVNTPPGDQVSYGANSWIGYAYATIDTANPPTNTFTTNYRGYLTQPETFDMDLGGNPLNGPNICGSYASRFGIRFKMQKNFAAGYYTFIVGGDDGYRLSLDGGATFIVNNYTDHGYTTSSTAPIYISGSTDLVIEYYEQGGVSRVSFQYLSCTSYSSAPTAISGDTNICRSTAGTLTAAGGTAAPGSTYQWGTGTTVGANPIAGQTGATIPINITANTTYWVRRYDPNPCGLYTTGITQLVTVRIPSTAPSAFTASTTICQGASINLVASGGTNGTGGQYEFGTGSVVGTNPIALQNSATYAVSPTENTTYWVRRVDPAPCSTKTSGLTMTVTVSKPSTAPTSISGPSALCPDTGGTTLTAVGAVLGSNGTYQWGSGSTVGNGATLGTSSTLYVNPTVTTTYWVRVNDQAPCTSSTAGVLFTITVNTKSTAPTSINNSSTACANGPLTLTAAGGILGTGAVYSWGTGYSIGQNVIAGENGASIVVNPLVQTVYWVNRIDGTPCTTSTQGPTIVVSVRSTPPTDISGINSICAGFGGTQLTANGGNSAPNAVFQWGTGSVVGNNPINGSTVNTLYVNPTSTTTYWVRRSDAAPCNAFTSGVTFTVNVSNQSTAPTSISGNVNICEGTSTTLTAVGGTLSPGSIYNWGTGYTVGNNVISGETGASITVSPSAQTVYWVRRVDGAPCNFSTQGPTVIVNVTPASTAPTSISGAPASAVCAGTSVTLTANGGASVNGAVFQWGTGNVGGSIIAGQTSASITVSPSATTTYWVRRKDGMPCNNFTTAASTTVNIIGVSGNPAAFASNAWFTFGYSGNDISLATDTYIGYYLTNTVIGVDTANGTNSWATNLSPSAASGWIGCPVPNDNFTMVHKRRGFPCGTYTITTDNWDDKAELYIDGVKVWSCGSYFGGGACAAFSGSYNLNSTSTIEFRVSENTGAAVAKLSVTKTNADATAPTTLAGNSPVCPGVATILTASGGSNGTNGIFQWGTGSVVGSNIVTGETEATYSPSPTVTTTYWVRRIDAICGSTTNGVFKTITVQPGVTAGTLATSSAEVCRNTRPSDIVLSGNTGSVVKWQSADDSNFTINVIDIASTSTTLTSAQIGNITSTKYFRAVVQGPCDTKNTTPVVFTIGAIAIYSNGAWSTPPMAISTILVKSSLTLPSTLKVCSCQISDNAVLTIPTNVSLVVENDVIVDAGSNMMIRSGGSLVQINDNAINQGTITVKRNTTPMKLYDFNYWSSPVEGVTLNQLSPNTLGDKYFKFNPVANSWTTITSGLETMVPSKGYIVRAPQGWSQTNASSGIYEGVFNGKPNSGVVNVLIQKGVGANNLIGNPYPSAIDIDAFLLDPVNQAVVNGTVYLWTHNTAISTQIAGPNTYNYTSDDYAKYNLTGGIKTAATAITGGVAPTGKIASGQGFFIEAKPGIAAGDYTARFSNKMRVAEMNNEYYRPITDQTNHYNALDKNRLWLNITSTGGAYNETLLGYVTNATNGYDNLYDGKLFGNGNVLSIYSMLDETTSLCIQGRALPLDTNDVIPLGYRSNFAGNITIGIEALDGFFTNQTVYLLDKTTNVCTNLKTGSYTFFSASGTFNTRFELRYKQPLGQKFEPIQEPLIAAVAADKQKVSVIANAQILEVQIYDILGKLLLKADGVNANEFAAQLNVPNQVLIVKTKLNDGNYYTQKIVLQ